MRLHLIQSHQEFSIVYKYGKPTVLTWQSLESGKRKSEGILERQTSLHTPSSLFSPLQLWLKGRWWQVALSITHWETGLGWILLGETAGQTRFLALDTKTHSCSSRKTPSLTESLRETHKQVWGERVQPFFFFFHNGLTFMAVCELCGLKSQPREQHVPLKTLSVDESEKNIPL